LTRHTKILREIFLPEGSASDYGASDDFSPPGGLRRFAVFIPDGTSHHGDASDIMKRAQAYGLEAIGKGGGVWVTGDDRRAIEEYLDDCAILPDDVEWHEGP